MRYTGWSAGADPHRDTPYQGWGEQHGEEVRGSPAGQCVAATRGRCQGARRHAGEGVGRRIKRAPYARDRGQHDTEIASEFCQHVYHQAREQGDEQATCRRCHDGDTAATDGDAAHNPIRTIAGFRTGQGSHDDHNNHFARGTPGARPSGTAQRPRRHPPVGSTARGTHGAQRPDGACARLGDGHARTLRLR